MKKNDVGSIDKFPKKLQEYFGGSMDDNRMLADVFFKCFMETLCEGRYVYNGEMGYVRLMVRYDDQGREIFRFGLNPSDSLHSTLKNSKLDIISSAKMLRKIEWMHKNEIDVKTDSDKMRQLVDKYLGNKDDLTVKEMINLLREDKL